ncbi:MAG: FAD-dependent oxidoreductase [Thermoleophilia bacterium]|nr:FAD-dependent oxidoreductase [Actinomycetota bacterium]
MRIAVIGSGIGGLGAAWLLSRTHEVDVFERDSRIGGHSHTTRVIGPDGERLALDSGFIVHNEVTYPLLVRMLRELGVATQPSRMGFSVTCAACDLEFSGVRLWTQPGAFMRPAFVRMIPDAVRFQRTGDRALLPRYAGLTLREFARAEGYSQRFIDHYLVPITSAIWSAGQEDSRDFPAAYAVEFWRNHGILGFRRLEWRTITGGSDTYVRAITAGLGDRVHAGLGVTEVRRDGDGVDLRTDDGNVRRFDHVVMAAHAHQSLAMLADASDEERRILSVFRTTESDVSLHADSTLLPRRRRARAAWNHHVDDCHASYAAPAMTYSLNRLQDLSSRTEWCVSLNRDDEVDPARLVMRTRFAHPVHDFNALEAQNDMQAIQGVRRTWFSGAWMGNGFHEDGMRAAVGVAKGLGVNW